MLTHVGLFEGSGIPSLAAASVGIKTTAYSEVDPACCYALAKLWPDAIPLGDVKTADWSLVPQPVFILTAGVPCQPVSTAGKQKGDKDERWLWPETIRAVRELRPSWLLFENPSAIILHGLEQIVAEMEGLGYEFIPKGPDGRFTPLRVGAWAVGAPHKRDRVWIVAHSDDCRRQRGWNGRNEPTRDTSGRRTDNSDSVARSWALADPIGNLCGRGRDESERGPEGRTAAGRAGETVGHPASDDQRRAPVAAMHGERKPPGGSSGGCGELADSDSPRLSQPVCERGDSREEQPAAIGSRWPARPGEQQYPWEAPRLVEFGVGGPATRLARRIHERLDGGGNGISPDRAASRTNKTLLRMCGNSWVFPLAKLMFELIVELDRRIRLDA